jgi:NAD(P)-dependent dehydrogenase (short-subunit alcohol dehydrogenase family)
MTTSERPAALVTGAATRLGREFALALAGMGYDIALHYHSSEAAATETAAAIRACGVSALPLQQDLSQHAELAALVARARAGLPGLSVLVNSASRYAPGMLAETRPELVYEQYAVNLVAPMELTRAFAATRPATAAPGCVVNIIDNKVAFAQFPYAAYLLSKKSLVEFTRMAALEYAPHIRVNGLSPGVVMPAAVRTDDYVQWRLDGIPLHRQGRPEQLCLALRYLLENSFVTGQVLTVDGGEGIAQVGRHSENYPGRQ